MRSLDFICQRRFQCLSDVIFSLLYFIFGEGGEKRRAKLLLAAYRVPAILPDRWLDLIARGMNEILDINELIRTIGQQQFVAREPVPSITRGLPLVSNSVTVKISLFRQGRDRGGLAAIVSAHAHQSGLNRRGLLPSECLTGTGTSSESLTHCHILAKIRSKTQAYQVLWIFFSWPGNLVLST